jgi:hypothetical protein
VNRTREPAELAEPTPIAAGCHLGSGAGRCERPVPELLDAKALRAELGVTRAAAEAIMRRLSSSGGLRKVYVRRDDVRRYLDSRTFTKDQVAAWDGRAHANGRAPRQQRPRPVTRRRVLMQHNPNGEGL